MIPASFIQQLLDRADIAGLVGREVQLKKSGTNLMGLCPFHQEKSPSFTVNSAKQFFHCFGCGAHGTSIGWVMRRQNLGFVDAVKVLAEQMGMEVPHSGATQKSADPTLFTALEAAAAFFQSALHAPNHKAQEVRDYLRQRGLSIATQEKFRIGYAPGIGANASALRQALSQQGFNDEELLIRAGLLVRRDTGQVVERFRHRLMVAICDRRGRVVGFGGRALGDDEPKYLNSPETEIFHKGRLLFGLPQAMDAMRREGSAIVVEGYFDAMALSQAGILPVVASMGTAMGDEQINLLWSLVRTIHLCFDGDSAGQKATWRAIERILPTLHDGREVRLVRLPEGLDPDDLVKERGDSAARAMLQQGQRLSVVLIQELSEGYDGSSESKASLVHRAGLWLSAISAERAPIFRQDLMHQISRLINLPIESLLHTVSVKKSFEKKQYWKNQDELRLNHKAQRKAPNLEHHLLIEALLHPQEVHQILSGIKDPDSSIGKAIHWIADRYDEGGLPEHWGALVDMMNAEGFGELVLPWVEDITNAFSQDKPAPAPEDIEHRQRAKASANNKQDLQQTLLRLSQKVAQGEATDDERVQIQALTLQMRALHQNSSFSPLS